MVLRFEKSSCEVLLIQRKYPPYKNAWALPGGFLDREESALVAARRELYEETNLRLPRLVEFGSFSEPGRDPRGRTLTIAFYGVLTSGLTVAKAKDDAKNIGWFNVRRLPRLAFDHKEMIQLGLRKFRAARGAAAFKR